MLAPFRLTLPPTVLYGRGEAAKAAGLAAGLGRRVLLVHGRDPGRAAWLLRDLRAKGLAVQALGCPKEPDLPLLEAALAEAKPFAPDLVVGLGGGAALDLAKALAALIPSSGGPLDHLEGVGRGLPLTASPLPVIALPTTAGTGSEATRNAVIDVPSHRRKVSVRDDRMLPRIAIVDPALTDHCTRAVTLASGLDALTQVIEPWVSSRANPATDALCAATLGPGIAALMRLMRGEDADAREMMAWTSLAGGMALANAGLGAVHGLAGVIGGMTGAAHGAICGRLLPFVLEANARALPPEHRMAPRFALIDRMLAQAFRVGDGQGAEGLRLWSADAGLPSLAAQGLMAADVPEVAEAALAASSMQANPVTLDAATLAAILRKAM